MEPDVPSTSVPVPQTEQVGKAGNFGEPEELFPSALFSLKFTIYVLTLGFIFLQLVLPVWYISTLGKNSLMESFLYKIMLVLNL